LKHIRRGHEIALLALPRQSRTLREQVLARIACAEGQYVVCNPAGGFRNYTPDRAAYIRTWAAIVETLLKKPSLSKMQVVLMPHVLRPYWEDDRSVFAEIGQLVGGSSRLKIITHEMPASECRELVGGAFFSICGRMHAAVSCLQSGRPAIALSYSVKYGRVLGDDLGFAELLIPAAGSARWNASLVYELAQRVEAVEFGMSTLCDRIRERVERLATRERAVLAECAAAIGLVQ
jgi:colanic acid/amylovoran biosynthesis protein